MFGRKKPGPPDGPFAHTDDCKVLAADPHVEIPWNEVETRHWVRTCRCSEEHFRAPEPARVRLDPLDPATGRHAGQCEFAHETDPVLLRAVLRITPKDSYSLVSCNACEFSWQVPDYAERVAS